jgi:hypothetical protein
LKLGGSPGMSMSMMAVVGPCLASCAHLSWVAGKLQVVHAVLPYFILGRVHLLSAPVRDRISSFLLPFLHSSLSFAFYPYDTSVVRSNPYTMAGSHKYPPWRRVILVPFWTLQILFMIIMIGILALAVGVLNAAYDPNKDYGFGSDDKAVDDAVQAATN